MSVLSDWKSRRNVRAGLLTRARASVVYWGRRAGSAHGKAMLKEARARYALRVAQVADADRHIAASQGVSEVSNNGIGVIAGFEGFRSKPYQDSVGVWTIGYGETSGVTSHTVPWSQAFALSRLKTRVNRDYLAPVLAAAKAAGVALTQNEADALASLVYNCGPGILAAGHTMGNALRSKSKSSIANAFMVYDVAGGQHLPGLTRRRRAERALFLK